MALDQIPFSRKRLLRNKVYPFEEYFCTFDKYICTLVVGAVEQIPFLHKRLLRKVLKEPELLLKGGVAIAIERFKFLEAFETFERT